MWSRTLLGSMPPQSNLLPGLGSGTADAGLCFPKIDVGEASGAVAGPRGQCPRLRDRYIAARFLGVAPNAAGLRCVDAVVKAARLYFEEERADLAVELLELAAEELPKEPAFPLAQLEILYLARDRAGYVELAQRFRRMHSTSDAWPLVARLGRKIAPGEGLFGAAEGGRDEDHYGPWPDLPNWVRAAWDLTAEVAAADFHRAVRRAANAIVVSAGCTFALDGAP
jgi:hypothetical protein